MRITSFPLAPRVETVPIKISPTPDPEKHRFLIPLEGPPAYVSLLSKEPYTPPAVLSQPIGLPSNPRMSTSAPGEFMLTPETMRYLGSIVESFSHQIHAVELAYRNSEVRVELQRQEFKRQQEKACELVDIVGKLKSRRSGLTQYKLNAVLQKQKELMKRLDRVLQALMRNASPGPSEHEKKWFEELQRMHAEVLGLTKYEEGSLAARTSLVCDLRLFE
jgi:nucleoporin NUP82